MLNRTAIVIGPNWGDFAEKYLRDCIESVRAQDWGGQTKVFITDNESTGESVDLLRRMAPDAEILRNPRNDGFAKGNNDAMRAALSEGFDYIALFNMDVILDPSCLSRLIRAAESDEKIGAVQARLMLWPDKHIINSLGNVTHFLGFGYSRGNGEALDDPSTVTAGDICYPSGAAVLFKADVLRRVGLFDEEFWMYNEDQDIGWRMWLAGFRCTLAPDSVVYHKYEFKKGVSKYYLLDRNRILSMLKNYHVMTLLLIFPAFLVMECGVLAFSISSGWFLEKLRVYGYFLNPFGWPRLLALRRAAQGIRKVKDSSIIGMFAGRIWHREIGNVFLRAVNPMFQLYWNLVRRVVFW